MVEVAATLNSRPLTYVSSEDTEEPLTPSDLLIDYRFLTLLDLNIPDDPDYTPEGLTCRLSHLSCFEALLESLEEGIYAQTA